MPRLLLCPRCHQIHFPQPETTPRWMGAYDARRMLGISQWQLTKLFDAGLVGSIRVPGLKHRSLDRADVERLYAEGYKPARE